MRGKGQLHIEDIKEYIHSATTPLSFKFLARNTSELFCEKRTETTMKIVTGVLFLFTAVFLCLTVAEDTQEYRRGE